MNWSEFDSVLYLIQDNTILGKVWEGGEGWYWMTDGHWNMDSPESSEKDAKVAVKKSLGII